MTLEQARRLRCLGLNVFPVKPNDKTPDCDWKVYQSTHSTDAELCQWFGNGVPRNAGIPLGPVSGGLVVIDTDTPEAEAWAAANLPPTPMMTKTAKGYHRYYIVSTGEWANADLPAFLPVSDTLKIELKRHGQYVVAPGSIHPSGLVYAEVEPWPESLDVVPELPMAALSRLLFSHGAGTPTTKPALPESVASGGRNNTLFREASRLRRLGWSQREITEALQTVNRERCQPPLEERELAGIAASACKYEPALDPYPATEAGDAEYFAACFGDAVRFDHRRGRWLLFHGHHWLPQANGEVYRLALQSVRGRQLAATAITDEASRRNRLKWGLDGESRRRLGNLLALVQNIPPIADTGDAWDLDPWLLGVPNGVIDLKTGQRRDGHPDDRITMRTAVPFDANALCPLWDQTVHQIFGGDNELIAYFDRLVGYAITGDCREESLAFCWGSGANGKGTVMNTLGWLLGDYADDLPFSALELHERSGIPNDIAKIVGKRFVTSSETGETKRLNEARVKALTGRDPITARFLHREFFTFQPAAKFWLATNHKPLVRDSSVGFWRRIHLIPFTQSFVSKPDLQLKDKLRAEGPGILARAVRGCLGWQREGLNPPRIVREATDSYRADSMPLARFIDACCVVQPSARATFGELFDSYMRWCRESRETQRLTRREFGDALRSQFEIDASTKRNVVFVGVGLVSTSMTSDREF